MASIDTIIFIGRDKFQFYSGGQILTFALPPTIVKDLDILDGEAFKAAVLDFMNKNSINPGTTVILLSEGVCFISEPMLKKQKPEEALSAFLSTLPFESPAARILGDKIVGANKNLYQSMNEVVGGMGGRVKMISPSFLSKEMLGKSELDIDMVKFVLNNEEAFTKATFIYEAPVPVPKVVQPQTEKTSKRTTILIAAFFGLLFLLVIIWVLTRLR